MAPQLTKSQREQIIALRKRGARVGEIERKTGISRKSVSKWIARHEVYGRIVVHNRQHYERSTTSSQDENIVKMYRNNPMLPTSVAAVKYKVSPMTVRRRLREAGMVCRKPTKNSDLTEIEIKERMMFCLQYYSFDWENEIAVFVSDNIFKRETKNIAWEVEYENNLNANEIQSFPNRVHENLGFFSWMSSMGPGEIVELNKPLNPEDYIDILNDIIIPTVRTHYPEGNINLFHDNTRILQTDAVQKWSMSCKDVNLITWPLRNHDLNPFSNMCDVHWKDVDEIRREVNKIWESMRGKETCWHMVTGMRKRLSAVIDAKGGFIY